MQEIQLDHPLLEIRGALDFDRTDAGITPRRLPAWTRPQVPIFMELMVTQPSGVRLEFASDATELELELQLTRIKLGPKEARLATFDLVCNGECIATQRNNTGNVLCIDLRAPGKPEFIPGETQLVRFEQLPVGLNQYQLWLPTGAQVELRSLRISAQANFQPYGNRPAIRWLHHGSSISQCAEATSPTTSWPAVAAKLSNTDLLNLGLGGNCQLDPFVARTIRDIPADFISLKLGINVVNMDSMRERTFTPAVHGFIDTIREGQPSTPILIVSPIYCPSAETHPGPTLPNDEGKFVTFPGNEEIRAGCLTLGWIRKILSKVVAQRQQAGDTNLHYLDGLSLFSADDAGDLPDDLHPNGPGYVRMGERFNELAFVNGAFAETSAS